MSCKLLPQSLPSHSLPLLDRQERQQVAYLQAPQAWAVPQLSIPAKQSPPCWMCCLVAYSSLSCSVTPLHYFSPAYHACRYFSARDPSLVNGSSCIGVATASTPAGPFNSSASEALTCNEAMGGMIDPSPFVDTDGSVYLLYKVGRLLKRVHSDEQVSGRRGQQRCA